MKVVHTFPFIRLFRNQLTLMKRIQIVFHFNVIAEVADHLTKADLHGPQADYILSMKEKVTTDGIRLRGNNSFLMNKKKTFV